MSWLEWTRINLGHYVTTGHPGDRFEIIHIEAGWELTDRYTSNVAITSTLKAPPRRADQ